MDALFASGRIIDAILVLVAIEALVLILWRRGSSPLPLLCNLTSGAALMLAVRAALTGADWTVVAGCLALSGLAHGTEMVLRLDGTERAAPRPVRLDPNA
jgi:hypothetical protein